MEAGLREKGNTGSEKKCGSKYPMAPTSDESEKQTHTAKKRRENARLFFVYDKEDKNSQNNNAREQSGQKKKKQLAQRTRPVSLPPKRKKDLRPSLSF